MNTHDNAPDTLRLTSDERERMRAEMRGFMAQHPMRERVPFFSPSFLRVATPVAAFVVLCGGTVFAAEGALPNDTLYPVKVSVIEPLVAGTLSYSPATEARVSGALAERRLQETETLIARDRLDPETAMRMQASIAKHAGAAHAALAEAAAGGDAAEAVRISTDLQARMEAHSEIIENLAEDAPEADAISDAVAEQADRASDVGEALEERLDDVPEDAATLATETRASAQEAISEAEAALATAPGSDITEEARSLIGEAEVALGQQDGARLQDALRLARQASLMLAAQADIADE